MSEKLPKSLQRRLDKFTEAMEECESELGIDIAPDYDGDGIYFVELPYKSKHWMHLTEDEIETLIDIVENGIVQYMEFDRGEGEKEGWEIEFGQTDHTIQIDFTYDGESIYFVWLHEDGEMQVFEEKDPSKEAHYGKGWEDFLIKRGVDKSLVKKASREAEDYELED